MSHPPGEPYAEREAEHLADLVVVDGPCAGQVWTWVAGAGGYMAAQDSDGTICADVGALLIHTGAEIVRPHREDT